MNILIAGGTGFIGTHLCAELLKDGHSIFLLTRKSAQNSDAENLTFVKWNGIDIPETTQRFDVIINLSGAPIAGKPWTEKYKQTLLDSRILTTNAITKFINSAKSKPSVFINASASGYYESKTELITETSPAGSDFVASIVKQWEETANKADTRTILLRTGLVLGKDGGVLPQMLMPFKFGIAAYFGNGNQYFPWIHIDDVVGIIKFTINTNIEGPINLVAPEQVTLKELTKYIAKKKRSLFSMSIPAFFLTLALGQRSFLLLQSLRIKPEKLIVANYNFKFPTLASAIDNLLEEQK